MNFLAHFDLSHAAASSAFQLGALLPDMLGRAGLKLNQSQVDPEKLSRYPDLWAGMQLHWRADRHFHPSSFFVLGNELWKNALHQNGVLAVHKKFFLYHLIFEMWLDHIILKKNPGLADRMYAGLDVLDLSEINHFAEHVLQDRQSKLLAVVQDFRSRKFILDYADVYQFSGIASGVFGYVTGQKVGKSLMDPILQALESLSSSEDQIYLHWLEFKDQILEMKSM